MTIRNKSEPLSITHPELAKEADGWDPNHISHGSNRKLKWKCPKGHEYFAVVSKRTSRNDNCPICSHHMLQVGFNDLKTMNPKIAEQADGWDPSAFKFNDTRIKRNWKCKEGHHWQSTIQLRTRAMGCPVCQGDKIIVGMNDLATQFPQIAVEADGWDPKTVVSGSGRRRNWKCSQGHKWNSLVYSRTKLGTGCPVCSNKKINTGTNDLLTLFPVIAAQADGWDASLVFPQSNKRLNWICNLGHKYSTTPNHRTTRKDECPYCSGRKVLVGFNDLKTTNPLLAFQADGWDSTQVSKGSGEIRRWRCAEGHFWNAVISSRAIAGNGCPSCAETGFDPNGDGWLYFLTHPLWEMLQIGITNFPDDRLKKHKKIDWEVLELRGPMDGYLAQQWETAILRMLKAKGADLSNAEVAGKFDGYSEAWSKSTFRASSLKELMEKTEQFEESVKHHSR